VLALADFLAHLARDIDHVAAELQSLQDPAQATGALDLSAFPSAQARRKGIQVAGSAEDARGLERALWSYARDTADQERARVAAWERPRDWLLAVSVATATGATPRAPLRQWGLQEAAGAILPDGWTSADVSVVALRSHRAQPPRGLADRVGRIPTGDASIRVERFADTTGAIHTEVYIAGTKDFAVPSQSEAFDLESNIALTGALVAASLVAAEKAMRQAGIRDGDPVVFTGHSQGGLVAARLAESGRYDTRGLVMVGTPTGATPIRGDYPAVSLIHSDDIVPLLGGARRPSRGIQVERHSGQRAGDVTRAHSLDGYRDTARAADASPASHRWEDLPVAVGTGRGTDYRATRR
jgi:hypothetical protein